MESTQTASLISIFSALEELMKAVYGGEKYKDGIAIQTAEEVAA